jgi:hypothetical protein
VIDFQEIKSRHSIEGELSRRGVELKRAPGGFKARCPIHGGQKSYAFSINEKKQVWYCWSECRTGGDVLKLVMMLDGAADAKAAAEILEGRPLTDAERTRPAPVRTELARVVDTRMLPKVPKLYLGEERHWRAVAGLRKLFWVSMQMAQVEGCLRFCVAYDQPAYAILDGTTPCTVQARRMDGGLWFGDKKVMGVKGNWAAWPVGLAAAMRHPKATILLVEGTGDFLAGWDVRQHAIDVIPMAMFGAGQAIHPSALPLLEGRDVVIVEQHDEAGARAREAWGKQLREEARALSVRAWRVPGEGEDLNDFISAEGDAERILKEAV